MAAYVEVTKLHNPAKRKKKSFAFKKLKRRADGTFMKARYAKRNSSKRQRPAAKQRVKARGATRNPVPLLLEFGAPVLNPRGKSKMATKTRKRKKAAGYKVKNRRRSTANARPRVITMGSRRNPKRKTRTRKVEVVRYKVRKNPALFGAPTKPAEVAVMIAGGLLGVAGTKLGVTFLPANLITSNFAKVIASIAIAFAAGFIAKKAVPGGNFGDAVLFGGLMQAGSVTLNAFVPSIGAQLGLGEFVQANYTVPENPFVRRARQMAAAGSTAPTLATVPTPGVSGYGRPAFGRSSFGR